MKYSCDDIRYFLDHGDQQPEKELEFLNHIENCPACQRLANLQPELEETLAFHGGKTSHSSIEADVLERVRKFERKYNRDAHLEKLFIPIFGFIGILPIFLTIYYRADIKSLIGAIDFENISFNIISLVSGITLPDIDFSGIALTVSNSPLVILSLFTVTAIIWTFSIIETQKALK